MKTIFQKEWRENFKIAAIGFAIYTFILVARYRDSSQFFAALARGDNSWDFRNVQPLLAPDVLSMSMGFLAVFGAILGWVQIHNERHRDLWAFLVHRPISRTEIFFGKVLAGLCLYCVGAGLPLAGFMVMVATPGHFAAPFQWTMLLPLAAIFLVGLVYYLGGLLTGVRQARWYASRGLGLGAGIIVSFVIVRAPSFWRVLIILVPGILIVGAAAWGSFVNNGYYEGQPKSGRRALTAALMLGCFLVIAFVVTLFMSLLPEPQSSGTSYQMGIDGAVYKFIRTPGEPVSITDLKGVPVVDKKTGRPVRQNDFKMPASYDLSFDFGTNPPQFYSSEGFNGSGSYFSVWKQTPDTLWYWTPNGRLQGYDIGSRRFIGSMGPNGFTPGVSTGPDRFTRSESRYGNNYYDQSYPARTLMTDTAVYKLDYDNRTSTLFFTTTNNERIGAATDVCFGIGSWDYTLVATKNSVRVLTPDGNTYSQSSFGPVDPLYSYVRVYFLSPNIAYWFNPNYVTNELRGWTIPEHIEWVAADQSVVKTKDLPQQANEWNESFARRLPNLVVAPPAIYLISPVMNTRIAPKYYIRFLKSEWQEILGSVAAAVIYAGMGLGLGRRYNFTLNDQVKWAVFILLFGLPGLLAFICVQEWPARVTCPHCKELRRVDRETCEHCGAGAESPAQNGTEIFEMASGK